jgi:hypothetical protein
MRPVTSDFRLEQEGSECGGYRKREQEPMANQTVRIENRSEETGKSLRKGKT